MLGEIEHIEFLYYRYQAAIQSNIVEDILKAGELYFNAVRDGEMTGEDRDELQKEILSCALKKKIEPPIINKS